MIKLAQKEYNYYVQGLSCGDCSTKIVKSLKQSGYSSVNLNFSTCRLSIDSDNLQKINLIISSIEPGAKAIAEKADQPQLLQDKSEKNLQIRLLISSILFLSGLGVTFFPFFESTFPLEYIFFFSAYFIAGIHVLEKAIRRIITLDIANEYFLMSIATIGAILIQEVPEAAAVMVFYTVGEYFQSRAVNRSRRSISDLMDIRPDEAHLIKDNEIVTIPAPNIKPGDRILVKPGERVPLDGILLTDDAYIDLSALTGESRPVHVTSGKQVLSGAITNKSINIEVTVEFSQSTVSRILDVVENAAQNKSAKENFISRFARTYTPLILVLAILIAIFPPLILSQPFKIWIYRALVVLVISCPCALILSIPLVYFAGIGKSSRSGILLKGANVIDSLTDIHAVLWDKTGTLTRGEFKVTLIEPFGDYTIEQVLEYAALAEAYSSHPIAISIREAYGKDIDLTQIADYEELPALGIKMHMKNGISIIVGNDKMVHEIDCPHPFCIDEDTAVYVVLNNEYIGYLLIDDQLKPTSQQAITNLKSKRISRVGLLTGDTKNIAERVGGEIGIERDSIYASLMPLNKLEILERYLHDESRAGSVIFIGDGINDAPVIARADVGIAMGGIGSDSSIEAADLVIMDDNPDRLNDAIEIAHDTNKIAKQNIAMAIGIKLVFIALGTLGLASMWVAVFGDVGVTLLTVLNSLRLLK
jgi:Cd2+/Zn2+-exporting ATPase